MFFNKLFSKTTVPVLDAVVGFTEKRHMVIADNIANNNTAGFKTRDLDVAAFNKQLIGAITQRQRPGRIGQFSFPNSQRVGLDAGGFIQATPFTETNTGYLRHNGDNVDPLAEQSKLTKNWVLHEVASELLRKQYSMLETAISERVG